LRHLGWSWLVGAAAAVTVATSATAQLASTSPSARGGARPVSFVNRSDAAAAPLADDAAEALPASIAVTPAPAPAPVATETSGGLIPPAARTPPWWSGVCDVNDHPGSFPLSSWDGLTACAPGPNRGGYDQTVLYFPGAWGEYEWECVELSMRWMYLEYGVHPYAANGAGVVSNYSPADGGDLHAVANDGSSVPQPGDVISMGSDWEEGHTVVVTGTHVVHGNGYISILEQNANGGNGQNTIAVVDDYVEPEYGFTVTGWLAVPTLPTPLSGAGQVAASGGTMPPALEVSLDDFDAGGPGRLAAQMAAAAEAAAQAGTWPPPGASSFLQQSRATFRQVVGYRHSSG
jgi:hypothetical protein